MSTAKMYQYLTSLGYSGSLADKTNAYYTDLIANGGNNNQPAVGEYVPERESWRSNAVINTGSQVVMLTPFTATRSEPINNIAAYTGTTAAAATPTLCRYAVWSIDNLGNMTLEASTANDTTLWAATTTKYQKSFTTTFNKVGGRRYAAGLLCVTAFALPTFVGDLSGLPSTAYPEALVLPMLSCRYGGQADIPSSIPVGSMSGYGSRIGFVLS